MLSSYRNVVGKSKFHLDAEKLYSVRWSSHLSSGFPRSYFSPPKRPHLVLFNTLLHPPPPNAEMLNTLILSLPAQVRWGVGGGEGGSVLPRHKLRENTCRVVLQRESLKSHAACWVIAQNL